MTTSTGPDILEVIADLSNDEVFTPPKVANAVLDLLPDDVWTNPDLRWLDPGTKTGVFLREVTKRLMVGLEPVIPDEDDRLTHILTNMVFGIAITELTSLMSRRTLYCSKDASSEHSTVRLPAPTGNVWFNRIEHSYDKGRCGECGAAESQLKRGEDRENYAYAFIHSLGRVGVWKDMDMKFDVIVGNPPYQMDAESGNRTMPLYNLFINQAKSLNPRYMAMIIPSRWMAGGLGLNEFRADMLGDRRVRKLVDFPNASEVFPGVEIKGGVCYLFWNRDEEGRCEVTMHRGDTVVGPESRDLGQFDVFVRDGRALTILSKVLEDGAPSLMEILAVDKEFGWTSNFDGFHQEKRAGDVAIHYIRGGKRLSGWISRRDVTKSAHLIDTWKVMIPQAYGAGESIPHQILGQPFVAVSPSVCTQTYLFVFVGSRREAESVESYVRSRFVRFLISLRKMTQHATRSTYLWVPQQSWDHKWTDDELYKKYGITEDEQAYIAEMVKEMPA